jgi:hypothetical protein
MNAHPTPQAKHADTFKHILKNFLAMVNMEN